MSSYDTGCGDYPKSDNEITASISLLTDKFKALCEFRDHYFENHPIEDAPKRNDDVQSEINQALLIFDQNEDCAIKQHRAKYYYLKGAALNVSPTYNQKAEELLSKAIKLDPKLVDAWNELGKCYCKNSNIKEGISCYTNALNLERNKIALRSLSILSRQEQAKSKEEKIANVERGLALAKEAVQLDPNDGLSWLILGNAHLSSFFGISQNPKVFKQCLSAYAQAEKDVTARCSPDLHYNKALVLRYEEEFESALNSFELALKYDPGWDPPITKRKHLLKYLGDICKFVSTSGQMKAKRLQQLLQSIDNKQLGPYGGGSYTSPKTGQTLKLKQESFENLKLGLNEETVVLGKVVCSVQNEEGFPFTFCLVDKLGTCVVVTIYNIADGKGVIIGDAVAIPEPYASDIDFKYNDKEYKFRLLRVETPIILVVNGKKVSRDLQAVVQMSLFQKFD